MTVRFSALAQICLLVATAPWGCLAAERLDDSASPRAMVHAPAMVSEWGAPLDQYSPDTPLPRHGIADFGRVEYRLATERYVGRVVRIYFVIPLQMQLLRSPQGLRVTWHAEGRFASGAGHPGDRVLVWSGQVLEPMMMETFSLRMDYTLSELLPPAVRGLSVECYFEIEVVS